MVNSGFLNGLEVAEAKKAITAWLEEKGLAKFAAGEGAQKKNDGRGSKKHDKNEAQQPLPVDVPFLLLT